MMAKKAQKYYAIRHGRQSNIVVKSWIECKELTQGTRSQFKSFPTYEEAEAYLKQKVYPKEVYIRYIRNRIRRGVPIKVIKQIVDILEKLEEK